MNRDTKPATSPGRQRKATGPNPRSAARTGAVQALYQMDMSGSDVAAVIHEFATLRFAKAEDGTPDATPETDETAAEADKALRVADPVFFAELMRGVVRRQRDIDPMIDQQLATGWRLGRVDSILRAILRAATLELVERHDVPARVIINEYVNVAHAFFSEDEPRVVNGVLDRLARRLRVSEFEDRQPEKPNSGSAGSGASTDHGTDGG